MSDRAAHVTSRVTIWRSNCSCTWVGWFRDTRREARDDGQDHESATRDSRTEHDIRL